MHTSSSGKDTTAKTAFQRSSLPWKSSVTSGATSGGWNKTKDESMSACLHCNSRRHLQSQVMGTDSNKPSAVTSNTQASNKQGVIKETSNPHARRKIRFARAVL